MSNEEVITEHEHCPCEETKCIGIERQGLEPYSQKYFPHLKARSSTSALMRPHQFKGVHSGHRARLWSTTYAKGHEMKKGAQHIHNSIWLRYVTQDPDRTPWVQLEQGESMKRSAARQFDAGSMEPANTQQPKHQSYAHCVLVVAPCTLANNPPNQYTGRGAKGTMKRGYTTTAWHKNYERQNSTGTWSSQD
ncbi:hypothetical protein GOBAR_AA13373 [Gossypium barbadense]|uniref:Uncharacterized protein n=1 Tax=Gossypium barbadense TaxID=3634 RepID=A0A2P5XVH0_GOSBA|nr:hypothetical protein GOBAR_AA13373 [Gossypium barbadense]